VAKRTFIPEWAEVRSTRITVMTVAGIMLAGLFSATSFLAFERVGLWVGSFFSTLIPLALILLLLLAIVARRVMVGPAREQGIKPTRLLVGYVLATGPVLIAAICLLSLAIVSWALDWSAQTRFGQALVILMLSAFVLSVTTKIVLNTQLLLTYMRKR
jgi:hypothetical protein